MEVECNGIHCKVCNNYIPIGQVKFHLENGRVFVSETDDIICNVCGTVHRLDDVKIQLHFDVVDEKNTEELFNEDKLNKFLELNATTPHISFIIQCKTSKQADILFKQLDKRKFKWQGPPLEDPVDLNGDTCWRFRKEETGYYFVKHQTYNGNVIPTNLIQFLNVTDYTKYNASNVYQFEDFIFRKI